VLVAGGVAFDVGRTQPASAELYTQATPADLAGQLVTDSTPTRDPLLATSRALAIWAGRPALPWSRYWTFRSRVRPLSLGRQRPAFESSLAANLD
jgi:hypothetical protein